MLLFLDVIVLQSLPSNEIQTGKKILDDIDILKAYNPKITSQFIDINNKKEFIFNLSLIEQTVFEKNRIPIIHLETHGSRDKKGIILKNDDFVPWRELKEPLTRINQATKMNLIVLSSLCFGAYLLEILSPNDRAPFWSMIGPSDEISPYQIIDFFVPLYSAFLKSKGGNINLTEIFSNSKIESADIKFISAERAFRAIYQNYKKESCDTKALQKRAKKQRKMMMIRDNLEKISPSLKEFKAEFLSKDNHREIFEIYKEKFFMIDLYPENIERFKVNFNTIESRDEFLCYK